MVIVKPKLRDSSSACGLPKRVTGFADLGSQRFTDSDAVCFAKPQAARLILVGLLLLVVQGCAPALNVDLIPANSHQVLQARFSRAYFDPSASGEDRVVLLSDPIDDPADNNSGESLAPSTAPPLWQVLYIELHWRAGSVPRGEPLVAGNAVLHWYVYGKPTGTHMGAIHYVGTGAVQLSTDSSGATVTVSNTDLRLLDQHGELRDPFKSFQINTEFHAATDPTHLRQTLSDVNKAIAEADAADKPTTRPMIDLH